MWPQQIDGCNVIVHGIVFEDLTITLDLTDDSSLRLDRLGDLEIHAAPTPLVTELDDAMARPISGEHVYVEVELPDTYVIGIGRKKCRSFSVDCPTGVEWNVNEENFGVTLRNGIITFRPDDCESSDCDCGHCPGESVPNRIPARSGGDLNGVA